MEYVALLRGINVGGNNKVVMSELREQVAAEGFANVRTYINSGNLLFEAEADVPRDEVAEAVEHVLARRYDFPIRLALLTGQDYLAELHNLPDWSPAATRSSTRGASTVVTCASVSRPWNWATKPCTSASTPCFGANPTRRSS